MQNEQPSRDEVRRNLTQTVIARPLIDRIESSREPEIVYDVIIDPNLDFDGGREKAFERIRDLIGSPNIRFDAAHPYIFANLTGPEIRRIAAIDSARSTVKIASDPGKQRLTLS